MGAPRLLDKRQVTASAALETTRKIKEGISLAKKVDAVRDTLGEEEAKLESFRANTIQQIQREIDVKIAERDSLIAGNEKLKVERIQLQAPLDLKEEWNRVNEQRFENEAWTSKMIDQQVEQIAREADIQSSFDESLIRERKSKEREELSERTLLDSERLFDEASKVWDEAKAKSAKTIERANAKERDVAIQEQELEIWDSDLRRLEAALKEKDADLSNRETALKNRYETFMKAQDYIKNKRK